MGLLGEPFGEARTLVSSLGVGIGSTRSSPGPRYLAAPITTLSRARSKATQASVIRVG
ncbi:hypothetical protein D3C73_1586330 [compost metagenome]